MTDSKIKEFFRYILRSKIFAMLTWLNQSVTLIVVPGSHRNSVTVKFRPIYPILLIIVLAGVVGTSGLILSKGNKAQEAAASMLGELEEGRKASGEIHEQVESMIQLVDRFQNTMSLWNEKPQESSLGTDSESQDLADITSAVGMVNFGNMNDVESLKVLNSAIDNSISPLKESLSLLMTYNQLLRELPTMWPIKNQQARVSFLFGPNLDPISLGRWYLHRGLDIAPTPGTSIVAAAGGKVVKVDYNPSGYGNYVIIKHKFGIYTLYAHQQRVLVNVGTIVSQGDTIGLVGSTGRVTGPHLHFEIRIGSQVVDPVVYLRMARTNNLHVAGKNQQ